MRVGGETERVALAVRNDGDDQLEAVNMLKTSNISELVPDRPGYRGLACFAELRGGKEYCCIKW